ncbi:hypothetical protein JCM24511_09936 [Saitozyma sp. JCM 24511]|nr:hypothetical protein JCM24511_09936 [Saitozyma sp. JCM 24511]
MHDCAGTGCMRRWGNDVEGVRIDGNGGPDIADAYKGHGDGSASLHLAVLGDRRSKEEDLIDLQG